MEVDRQRLHRRDGQRRRHQPGAHQYQPHRTFIHFPFNASFLVAVPMRSPATSLSVLCARQVAQLPLVSQSRAKKFEKLADSAYATTKHQQIQFLLKVLPLTSSRNARLAGSLSLLVVLTRFDVSRPRTSTCWAWR